MTSIKVGDPIVLTIGGLVVSTIVQSVEPASARPPAKATKIQMPTLPVEGRLGNRTVRADDVVTVLPSAPRKHDGYVGRITRLLVQGGLVVEACVVPAHGFNDGKVFKGSISGERTYRADRLKARNQKRGDA